MSANYSFLGCLIMNKPCQNGKKCDSCDVSKKFSTPGELNEYDRENFYLFERSLMLGEVAVFTNRTQTVGCLPTGLLQRLFETASDIVCCTPADPALEEKFILKSYPLLDKLKRVNMLGKPDKMFVDTDASKAAVFVYGERSFLVAPLAVVNEKGENRD